MTIYRETLGSSLHRIRHSQVLHLAMNTIIARQSTRILISFVIGGWTSLYLILILFGCGFILEFYFVSPKLDGPYIDPIVSNSDSVSPELDGPYIDLMVSNPEPSI